MSTEKTSLENFNELLGQLSPEAQEEVLYTATNECRERLWLIAPHGKFRVAWKNVEDESGFAVEDFDTYEAAEKRSDTLNPNQGLPRIFDDKGECLMVRVLR